MNNDISCKGYYSDFDKAIYVTASLGESRGVIDTLMLGGTLSVSRVFVPPQIRNEGVGTCMMSKLIDIADDNKIDLNLTINAYGDLSREKLAKWYSNFGFVLSADTCGLYERMHKTLTPTDIVKRDLRRKVEECSSNSTKEEFNRALFLFDKLNLHKPWSSVVEFDLPCNISDLMVSVDNECSDIAECVMREMGNGIVCYMLTESVETVCDLVLETWQGTRMYSNHYFWTDGGVVIDLFMNKYKTIPFEDYCKKVTGSNPNNNIVIYPHCSRSGEIFFSANERSM